jgi:hypothetical protein
MASATLQINFSPKRMLSKSEAANHCGRSVKRFEAECPFQPVRFPNGDIRYDVQDCDAWINSLKTETKEDDAETLVARLGK